MRVEPHPTNLAEFLSGTDLLDKTGFFKKVSPILPGLILEKGKAFSKRLVTFTGLLVTCTLNYHDQVLTVKGTLSDGTSGAQPR